MTALFIVVLFASFGMLASIWALIRERRLRLALQALLHKILDRWRNRVHVHFEDEPGAGPDDATDGRM
jgi:hypothetical protein